nr:hypothetical protein [Minwuia thermotolerans]
MLDPVRWILDDVALREETQVVVPGADIDETAVLVAVGGGEARAAAAALDCQQDADIVGGFDLAQFRVDAGDDRRVEALLK